MVLLCCRGPGSTQDGYAVSQRLMHQLNVSSLQALRAAPASLLQWPHSDALGLEFPGYWIDNDVAIVHPRQAYLTNSSTIHSNEMIVGATNRDGVVTADPYYASPAVPATTASFSQYEGLMQQHWGGKFIPSLAPNASLGLAVAGQYSPNRSVFGSNPAAAFVSADGDYNVLCSALELADAVGRQGRKTFAYLFAHGPLCGAAPISKV